MPEEHEHDNENEEKNEDDNKDEKPPGRPEDDDHDMQGRDASGACHNNDDTRNVELEPRRKRTETQENVFVKKRLMMNSPKRPATPVPPPEDPVKRRLMKKTDLRKDDLAMNVDADLLNTVNTFLSDETVPGTNLCEDSEQPKTLTILDDPKEVMKDVRWS